jgi:hypothetical protein
VAAVSPDNGDVNHDTDETGYVPKIFSLFINESCERHERFVN